MILVQGIGALSMNLEGGRMNYAAAETTEERGKSRRKYESHRLKSKYLRTRGEICCLAARRAMALLVSVIRFTITGLVSDSAGV